MKYTEIDWSKSRNGKDMTEIPKDEFKELAIECSKMGLTIRQSVDLIVRIMG